MNPKPQQAGGLALAAQRGRDYMAEIGRRGAEAFWKKYTIIPHRTSSWAIVERATGKVINFLSERPY